MFRMVLFTLEQLKDDKSVARKVVHFTRIAYYGFCLFAFPVAITMIVAYVAVNSADLIRALGALPNAVTIALIAFKGFVTFINRKQIWTLILKLKAIFEDRPCESVKSKVKEHLDHYQKHVRPYAVTFILTGIPLAIPVLPYVLFGTMKETADFWFPFDPYTRGTFPLVLFWIDWITWNSTATLLGSDSLFFALTALVTMEFDILKRDLMAAMALPNEQRMKIMKSLVDHHNKLLELCGDLNEIYSPTFLASFVITSLSLCFVAFQLSAREVSFEIYSFCIPYLLLLSGQIYLVCAFGQNLIDAEEAIVEGIYESDWEDIVENPFKNQLVLIIQRSQRAKKLTAMGFAEVSLASFKTVSYQHMFV